MQNAYDRLVQAAQVGINTAASNPAAAAAAERTQAAPAKKQLADALPVSSDKLEAGPYKPLEPQQRQQVEAELRALARQTIEELDAAASAKPRISRLVKNGRELRTSASARGPCLSVAKDLDTGAVFYGQNYEGQIVPDLVPFLAGRVQAWKDAGNPAFVPMKLGWVGSHSEVDALNQALRARQDKSGRPTTEADLGRIAIYNIATQAFEGSPVGSAKVRCRGCNFVTAGAIVFPG